MGMIAWNYGENVSWVYDHPVSSSAHGQCRAMGNPSLPVPLTEGLPQTADVPVNFTGHENPVGATVYLRPRFNLAEKKKNS